MRGPEGKPRIAQEIVARLRDLILGGSFREGAKLPPERRLAEELGVNRASLREAIKALEQLGLVRTRQGDGTRVLNFMHTAGIELISYLIARSEESPDLDVIVDVLEFRRWFGRECARLAAERRSPEGLARLAELVERAADPGLDEATLLRVDFDFYVELTRMSRNRMLQLLINSIRAAVVRFAPFFARYSPPPAVVRRHQRALLRAIEDQDQAAAARIADAYLAHSVEELRASRPREAAPE